MHPCAVGLARGRNGEYRWWPPARTDARANGRSAVGRMAKALLLQRTPNNGVVPSCPSPRSDSMNARDGVTGKATAFKFERSRTSCARQREFTACRKWAETNRGNPARQAKIPPVEKFFTHPDPDNFDFGHGRPIRTPPRRTACAHRRTGSRPVPIDPPSPRKTSGEPNEPRRPRTA